MKFSLMKPHIEWNHIKSNWIIVWTHRLVLLLTISQLLSIISIFNRLPPSVPLWYSRPWGTDQLAPAIYLFVLPGITVGIHIVNTVFAMYITTEYLIFTQSLFLSSLVVSLLALVAVLKIIFLVL